MLNGLKALLESGDLLRQIRGMRREVRAVHAALERIAVALEFSNRMEYPQVSAFPRAAPVEISYVDDREQEEWMDIELRLTQARGMAPTEDEMLAEFERRHPMTERPS